MLPPLLAFDLDGTLATSKQAITEEISELLRRLLEQTCVALISGGKLSQLTVQVVEKLPEGSNLGNFYLLPTSGAALYTYGGNGWTAVYEEKLTDEECVRIENAIKKALQETALLGPSDEVYGERVERRGTQVTFSALGQQAPVEAKALWDPTHEKRQRIQEVLSPLLPEFDVKQGGMTTIDITRKGVNKAYGMRKLSEYLNIPVPMMLYVGDALFPGGNDFVVIETEIQTHAVADPADTALYIKSLLENPS
jgi:HAD superfamily hydrolase (TIGR01484 family)